MFKKITVILTLITAAIFLCSCKKAVDLTPYLSQIRTDILVGENENYAVKCYLETREKPQNADGKKENVYPAVIVKLTVKNGEEKTESGVKVNFKADKEYSSSFVFHPESSSYVATVFVDALPEKSLEIFIVKEGGAESIVLKSVIKEGTASPAEVLSFAQKNCAELIETENFKNGKFEINLRLLSDDDKLYYYVGFITEDETEALLVSSDAKKVIARKTLKNR